MPACCIKKKTRGFYKVVSQAAGIFLNTIQLWQRMQISCNIYMSLSEKLLYRL